MKGPHLRTLPTSLIIFTLFINSLLSAALYLTTQVSAQSSCPAGGAPPVSPRGRLDAWPQNTLVAVNVNSQQFTPAEFECISSVFDNFNLQAAATQGNFSGVRFSVTYSTYTVATVNSSTNMAVNSSGIHHGLQVNKPPQGSLRRI